jgi:alpha-galactosidase
MSEGGSQRIVLIGAGSAQFGFDILGDIFQSEVLRGAHVVLLDIDAEAVERVRGAGQRFIDEHALRFTVSATTDRKSALRGADFCVISIEVGDRFALWEQDRTVPQQYGFRQVFGENGGPGGLFHTFRVVPPILEICRDIQDICPDAHVFNYSNPMSRICTTVHRAFPDLRFIGLCHEIASLRHCLPKILDTPIENIEYRAAGLNHFSVLLEASRRDTGQDAYPEIREKAADYFESLPCLGSILKRLVAVAEGCDPDSAPALEDRAHPWAERGLFRILLERFGYLPITTDSHLGEYVQWAHEVVDHEGILDFYSYYKQWTQRSEPQIQLAQSERLVSIIEGILCDTGYEEAAVNVPNRGFIAQLPEFIVVEVPAIVDAKGVHGVSLGALPHGFAGLLCNQIAVHDLAAEAILQRSRDLALQALLVDPNVDQFSNAEKLLDHMIALQEEHLGYLR